MPNAAIRPYAGMLLLAAACVVESGRPPVTAGDGVTVDAASQTIGIDAAKVPIHAPCAVGEVLRRTATGWECAKIPEVSPDHIPSVPSCEPGQLVARTASGWACVTGPDPAKTPQVSDCVPGTFLTRTATGWACASAFDPDATPAVDGCRAGEVIMRTDSGWACAPAIDPARTPLVTGCSPGQVVTATGTGFTCAPALDPGVTPVVPTCAPGQLVSRTAGGWACVAPGPDPARTPIVPTCAAGQYVRRTASGWECSNLVGDLTGNVAGNVTGDTTGLHTGAVVGNVTGNLAGNVTGNLTGDSTGTHTGPVVGNVTGNLTGNVVGNVTGDVSGTAANVTGIVPVAHGGTGASSFPAGALLQMGSGVVQGFGPGPDGSLVGVAAGQFAPVSPTDLNLVQRTSATKTIYVRPNGSDTNCNGSADVDDAPSARPNCAVASPQKGLDKLPDVLHHPVAVVLAPGTYRVAPGAVGLDVAKIARSGATLAIRGNGSAGSIILSGDTGGASLASRGVFTSNPIETLTISNLAFDHFSDAAIRISRASATISGVSATAAGNGLVCERGASCVLTDTNAFNANTGSGVVVTTASRVVAYGTLTANTNAYYGVYVEGASGWSQPGAVTLSGNGAQAMLFSGGSTGSVSGSLTISSNSHGILMNDRSLMSISGPLNITVSGTNSWALLASVHSYIAVSAGTAAVSLSCSTANTGAMLTQFNSTFFTGGTQAFTITGCTYGVISYWNSVFGDDSGGTRTLTSVANPVVVNYASGYSKGHFPAATGGSCANGSLCL